MLSLDHVFSLRIIATPSLTMDPLIVLKPQKFILKAFGLWSDKRNFLNYLHVTFAFYFISIGFILTLFTSMLFVGSMKQLIDNLIVTNSTILALLKGMVFYFKYSKHLQMFETIKKLDKEIDMQSNTEVNIFKSVNKLTNILSGGFGACYVFAWILLAIQSVFGSSEQVFWSSTALYPGEISQNVIVFWIIFIFQGFATLALVLVTFACDTYGIIVIIILNGYIDVLSSKLKNLGSEKLLTDSARTATKSSRTIDTSLEMIECVKTFYTCLR